MIDVYFLILPATLLMDVAGPAEAFRLANQRLARREQEPLFKLHFIAPAAQCTSSVGVQLADLQPLPERLEAHSWVVLLGQPSGQESSLTRPIPRAWARARLWLAQVVAPRLLVAAQNKNSSQLAAAQTQSTKLLCVCAGSLLAADAGLLAGRKCTTHHEMLEDLQRLAPSAKVLANRLFVQDGAVYSSAGISAGIDLALHLIAQACGSALAAAVAQAMVIYQRRASEDPQISPLLSGRSHLHAAVHRVQDAVCEHPEHDWPLPRMAEMACVSARHLARLFVEQVGCSPREYVQSIRVAHARQALEGGVIPKQAIDAAGFRSSRQWRRVRQRTQPSLT